MGGKFRNHQRLRCTIIRVQQRNHEIAANWTNPIAGFRAFELQGFESGLSLFSLSLSLSLLPLSLSLRRVFLSQPDLRHQNVARGARPSPLEKHVKASRFGSGCKHV